MTKKRESWFRAFWRMHGDGILLLVSLVGGLFALTGLILCLVAVQDKYPGLVEVLRSVIPLGFGVTIGVVALVAVVADVEAHRKELDDE